MENECYKKMNVLPKRNGCLYNVIIINRKRKTKKNSENLIKGYINI